MRSILTYEAIRVTMDDYFHLKRFFTILKELLAKLRAQTGHIPNTYEKDAVLVV